ncbi:MAG: hypothetical protein IJS53_01870 [Clostridia bacterium]|nr:hypothetical protein [Clostridia bacterium]
MLQLSKPKDPAARIRDLSDKATMAGLRRLTELLSDPASASGDVLKGLTLLFERVYRPEDGGSGGDFEIRLGP